MPGWSPRANRCKGLPRTPSLCPTAQTHPCPSTSVTTGRSRQRSCFPGPPDIVMAPIIPPWCPAIHLGATGPLSEQTTPLPPPGALLGQTHWCPEVTYRQQLEDKQGSPHNGDHSRCLDTSANQKVSKQKRGLRETGGLTQGQVTNAKSLGPRLAPFPLPPTQTPNRGVSNSLPRPHCWRLGYFFSLPTRFSKPGQT